MMQKKITRLGRLALALTLSIFIFAGVALAFAEEPLRFRDPYTGETGDNWEEISTVHNDLTYALALAAGFSITDAVTLQVWDQLVDSEYLHSSGTVSYTNCAGGAFPPPPQRSDVCTATHLINEIWPMWNSMKDPATCVTSRFGPYSPFFHFPHNNNADLGAFHDWAWGKTDVLTAYEAYAWGKVGEFTVMQASCLYTRTAVITTAMQAGSLEAFGSYLHTLADYYSHQECIAYMDGLGMPWATHTLTGGHTACQYNPASPQIDDAHGREFYTYTESIHTDRAIQHIYGELTARSLQREGEYYPLAMDTAISGTLTLSDALHIFVHQWDFEHPAERRAWLDQLVPAILTQRQPVQRVYLPLTLKR